jgi:amidase
MHPSKVLKNSFAFNLKDTVELRYFDQQLLELAQSKGDIESAEYKKALYTDDEGNA